MSRLCAGSEIVSILTALFPRVQLIDTSFPYLDSHWLHSDVINVLPPAGLASEHEQQFHARFRQHGGHMKLQSVDDLVADPDLRRAWSSSTGKTPVFAVAARHCFRLVDQLRTMPEHTVFLVHDSDHDPTIMAALAAIDPREAISLNMIRGARSETFHLLSRAPLGDASMDILIAVTKTFAVNLCAEPERAAWIGAPIRIILPEEGGAPKRVSLDARHMIHDGSRRSEAAGDYSWLWIGAERHMRIMLGALPRHFTSVRVTVPKAFSTADLRETKLLLNGRRVQSAVETWEEGAGALTVTLPKPDCELVLGIAAPATHKLDDGQTELALCIDRIELMA